MIIEQYGRERDGKGRGSTGGDGCGCNDGFCGGRDYGSAVGMQPNCRVAISEFFPGEATMFCMVALDAELLSLFVCVTVDVSLIWALKWLNSQKKKNLVSQKSKIEESHRLSMTLVGIHRPIQKQGIFRS